MNYYMNQIYNMNYYFFCISKIFYYLNFPVKT